MTSGTEVTPFRIDVPDDQLVDLRARLRGARWPDDQVSDWSQGVPTAQLRELCDHWASTYDWRATQKRLNTLPHFRTEIDGIGVHFVHVRSRSPGAVPVLLTHGWPGSFLEFEQTLRLLAGSATPAFDLVLPSLPGYAFSDKPAAPGWDIHRIARAWCALMARLGYDRFVAGGSDWGTSISTSIALQHPDRLLGLYLVPPLVPAQRDTDGRTDAERAALADLDERERTGSAYGLLHATRPQTIGYALADSPQGLAAWIGEKLWTWTDPASALSTNQILDNLSLYWFTNTAASSARLYWHSMNEVSRWFTDPVTDTVSVPVAAAVFPHEVPRPSRRWAEARFTKIVHWSEPPRGGHFGAWEQPDFVATDLRAAVAALLQG
jgi:pimeloyl-ACP methyl ester carboxylesterase